MGNILSVKFQNNAEIWKQTGRNAIYGCIIGILFTLWKFKKSVFRVFIGQNKVHNQNNKKDIKPEYNHDFRMILSSFIKFPIFIISFSILFKKLIRMNLLNKIDIKLADLRLHRSKYSISFMSFLLAYFITQNANIFHWKWPLLLLIRSLYALIRLNTPHKYKLSIFNIEYIHGVILSIQCIMAQQYASSLPNGLIATYNSALNYNRHKYINYYQHNHSKLPSCSSSNISFHRNKNDINCLKSFIKDAVLLNFIPSFSFFIKLHTISSIFNISKHLKSNNFKSNLISIAVAILRNTFFTTCYWVIGTHCGIRFCSCFSRILLKYIYYLFNYLMDNNYNNKYEYISERNVYFNLLIMTSIIGRYIILFETSPRRIEMTLGLIWYTTIQLIRKQCNLNTYDNDKYHYVLSSQSFVSLIFASCIAINMYVYCKDEKYLKSMERSIIHKFLIN